MKLYSTILGLCIILCGCQKENIQGPNNPKDTKAHKKEFEITGNLFSSTHLFTEKIYLEEDNTSLNKLPAFQNFIGQIWDELVSIQEKNQGANVGALFSLNQGDGFLVYEHIRTQATGAEELPGNLPPAFETITCYSEDCIGDFIKEQLEIHGGCALFKIERNALSATITSYPCP